MKTRRRRYPSPTPDDLRGRMKRRVSPLPPLPPDNAHLASMFDDFVNPWMPESRFAYVSEGFGIQRWKDEHGRWVYDYASD